MKKVFLFVLSMILFVSFINAKTYKIDETDISLNFSNEWYVFTRGNLKNNEDLKNFGVSEEYMEGVFNNNKAYLDAIMFVDNKSRVLEMFVRKDKNNLVKNSSNFPLDFTEDLKEEYKKKYPSAEASVYQSKYNWVLLSSIDNGKHLMEYITIVNGENYNLSFQSDKEFTSEEKSIFKGIIDSTVFDIDTSLVETYKYKKSESTIVNIFKKGLIGALVGGIVGGISAIINKKRKKEVTTNETQN